LPPGAFALKTMAIELNEQQKREMRPFFFEGDAVNDVGVLLLHGFTGSPAEMRPLGEYLSQHGYAAKAPLLPKHGGMPHDLKGAHWEEWAYEAKKALDELSRDYRHVVVAGLSMGGLLTLHLAATHTQAPIRGIVTMAAPAAINDVRAKLVKVARFFVPYYYPLKGADFNDPSFRAGLQQRMNNGQAVNLDDPRVQKEIAKGVKIPVSAIHELLELNALVMRELPQIKAPALLFQGKRDQVVSPDSVEAIAAGLGSTRKQVVWLDHSGHVLPHEPDHAEMFKQIEAFIQSIVKKRGIESQ
jgi:carboxylesterase